MRIIDITRLTAALLLFVSCTGGERIADRPSAQGTMTVVVTQMDADDEDRIETVRFIVFGDPDTDPALEVNTLFDGSEFDTGGASGSGGVSRLEVVLEVGLRTGVRNNKLVVVIANEPASMTAALDAVVLPEELEDMRLDFASFLNADHRTLIDDYPLPMTAAVWTDKVYATEGEAAADMVAVELQRAVARVDVYIEPDGGEDLTLSSGTSVTLGNTYDSQNFIYHADGTHTLGEIQTVGSGFMDMVWELSEETAVSGRQLLCSFYTPERTCSLPDNADKLTLTVVIHTTDGTVREGSAAIDSGNRESAGITPITAVERNNVYMVTVTAGAEVVTVWVNDWNGEDIYNEL